jgi:hypothetical protein
MWMQVLAGAGFPVIGEAFPGEWKQLIGSANPRGFFESTLISGINFTTNPDPDSGVFVEPELTRDFVVKIFLSGLRRTEFRYLDRVLISTREWRTFCDSARRLETMQQHVHPIDSPDSNTDLLHSEPAIKWWMDHYNMIQDQQRRGFDFLWLSYESVLSDPERMVSRILDWIDLPHDLPGALNAIDASLQTQSSTAYSCALAPRWIRAFDDLYGRVHQGREFDAVFRHEMDEVTREILYEIGPQDSWTHTS